MRLALGLTLACLLAATPTLKTRIERHIESSATRRAFWGVQAVDLKSGQILYQQNEDHFFVPASNTKLFTTALALQRLGPDYRFTTRVLASAQPSADGVVSGDLVLVGGGDPTMSGRAWPYTTNAPLGDPLQAVHGLADQVAAAGVRRVRGRLIGDDTRYVWEPYPVGWAADDALHAYGAPVSALTLNESAVAVTIRPATPGLPATLDLFPGVEYLTVLSRITTAVAGTEARVHYDRPAGARELHLWGSVPAGSEPSRLTFAVDDPARFAAHALAEALARRGVAVEGGIDVRHRPAEDVPDLARGTSTEPTGVVLATHRSRPLAEVLQLINKVSQNLHAELVLREVGRLRRGVGSRQAGLEELADFLKEVGADPADVALEDGSGLSRLGVVTPRSIVRLLTYMDRVPHAALWRDLLPIGGRDGTLSTRFKEPGQDGTRILAKTGTLRHVAALSGYGTRRNGERVAFAILVNNYQASSDEVVRAIDVTALLLVD